VNNEANVRHFPKAALTVAVKIDSEDKLTVAFARASRGDQWCRKTGTNIATGRSPPAGRVGAATFHFDALEAWMRRGSSVGIR
jgi:hypothetical protein